MHMNQSGCAVTGKQRVVGRSPHQCRICLASYVIKHGCIPSESIQNDSPTAVLVEFFFTEWIVINEYLNTLYWWALGEQCLCISSCVQRERERGWGTGADMFTASRTCDRVSLTVPLWLFPLCFVLHLVCQRKAISSSQNKSIASRRVLLSASMKIYLSILRLYVLRRMDWDGSYFLLKIWVS